MGKGVEVELRRLVSVLESLEHELRELVQIQRENQNDRRELAKRSLEHADRMAEILESGQRDNREHFESGIREMRKGREAIEHGPTFEPPSTS